MNYLPKPPNMFAELRDFNLYEKEGDGRLTILIRNGYPRIQVFTQKLEAGVPLDYNTVIISPFDLLTMITTIKYCRQYVDKLKPDMEITIEAHNVIYADGAPTKERKLQSIVTFGRDEEGCYYFSVTEETKRKIKFFIIPNDFTIFRDVTGSRVTDNGILSKMHTEVYLETLMHRLVEYGDKHRKTLNQVESKKPYVKTNNTPLSLDKPKTTKGSTDLDDIF